MKEIEVAVMIHGKKTSAQYLTRLSLSDEDYNRLTKALRLVGETARTKDDPLGVFISHQISVDNVPTKHRYYVADWSDEDLMNNLHNKLAAAEITYYFGRMVNDLHAEIKVNIL